MAAEAPEQEAPLEASSYRPLYRIQHVIYRVGDVRLPFPVGLDAVALFFAYLLPLAALARLTPVASALLGLPPFVLVPLAAALLAHASTKIEPAGKGVLAYMGGLAAYAARPRWWVRGMPAPRIPRAAAGKKLKVVPAPPRGRREAGDTAGSGGFPVPAGPDATERGAPALWGRPERRECCCASPAGAEERGAAGPEPEAWRPAGDGAAGPETQAPALGKTRPATRSPEPPLVWGPATPVGAEGEQEAKPIPAAGSLEQAVREGFAPGNAAGAAAGPAACGEKVAPARGRPAKRRNKTAYVKR